MEHRAINWIQIPATSLHRAVEFYKETFDFTFEFEELNGIHHALFSKGEYGDRPLNGAIIELKEGQTIGIGPILFFDATGKFDEILSRIEENGGMVIQEKTLIKKKIGPDKNLIPNTHIDDQPGYYAHWKDSEGNRMGLYGSY